jgi:hypothetical protein
VQRDTGFCATLFDRIYFDADKFPVRRFVVAVVYDRRPIRQGQGLLSFLFRHEPFANPFAHPLANADVEMIKDAANVSPSPMGRSGSDGEGRGGGGRSSKGPPDLPFSFASALSC